MHQIKKRLLIYRNSNLDLFQSAVKTSKDKKEFSIEGLITLEDVNKLTQGGYKVLIKKEAPKRTPAVDETSSFQNWKATTEKNLRAAAATTMKQEEKKIEREEKTTKRSILLHLCSHFQDI